MSIIQISKIQQRSGNLVDLPQLDEAEFGWASDAKKLYIGKTTPNENIEVLTSYSQINYSQINGTVGNLNISNVTVGNGQFLVYDGTDWVNRGGTAGGLLNLGDVSNVKITGGAIGYVLETDGLGNLSWTPKSSVISYIQNVTKADPAVVTTTQDNFFTDRTQITITDASGMTQLNGNTYYANILTSNTFSLYSDPSLTSTVNSTGYGQYSYTTATSTSASTNRVTVGNSALFSLNQEVRFLGDLSTSTLENNVSYYVKAAPSGTTITLSDELLANGTAGTTKTLATATLTGANVYAVGGRAISSVSTGGGSAAAAGSNSTVQFNNSNLLDGDADFTWNFGSSPKVLGIVGNANVGNLNASSVVTASRLISNVATGTSPLTVTSTTQVANLNAATAGTAGTVTTNAQPNITSVGTLSSLAITGNLTVDTNVLFVDTTNNRVGINTGSPGTALDVVVASPANNNGLQFRTSTTTLGLGKFGANAALYWGSGTNLSFMLSSTEAMKIDSTGNVGIGAAVPRANLSIGTANSAASTTQALHLGYSVADFYGYRVSATNNPASLFAGNFAIQRGNGSAWIDNITINNNGNVGIGTIPPESPFQVAQRFRVQSDGIVRWGADVRSASYFNSGYLSWDTGLLKIGYEGSGNIQFETSGSPKMHITSSGNVGIGTVAPPAKLSVNFAPSVGVPALGATATDVAFGAVGAYGTMFGTTSSGPGYIQQQRFDGTPTAYDLYLQPNGGNVGIGTTTPGLKLDVNGAARVTSGANGGFFGLNYSTSNSSSRSWAIYNDHTSFGDLNILQSSTQTGSPNTSRLYINPTGNVGIGNTAPAHTLSVTGTMNVSGNANVGNLGTSSVVATGNITSGNVYANSGTIGSGTVLTPIITTGANTTPGTITGNWTLTAGSRMQATYADLAENYVADAAYEPGTVLSFGGEFEVTLANSFDSTRVAGVVTTDPAYIMNGNCQGEHVATIALQGRVPCKVVGPVVKGDLMVSGSNGHAYANNIARAGTIIGKALENFEGGFGVIEVAVGRF